MLWANTLFNTKTKLVAAVLVVAFSVLSPLLSLADTAYAADATWKDSKTLSYGNTDYTGPSTPIGESSTIFSSDKGGTCGSRIVFTSNYKTATSAKLQTGGYADPVQHQCGSWSGGKTISVQKMPSDMANGSTTTNQDSDNDGVPDSKDKCDGTQNGAKVDSDGCASGQTKAGEAGPQCDAGSWSFMVCPFITSTQDILKTLFGYIADLSYFQPLPIGTPKKTPEWSIYYGWATFLTFANIAAVIGFLIIIFSQATSMGLSSYGVKKLLPKMAMVMVLMNVSYYLCAIAIDISNIIGASIVDVFNYIYATVGHHLNEQITDGGFSSSNLAEIWGFGATVIIIGAFFLVPVLITLLVIFGVLAARIAILTLLVIIAPLAFAAWILPNTEKYFHKWWSLFFDMLALYPALMAIYGGATLAANILLMNSQRSDGTFNNILPFAALLIQVLPLLAVPFIIKATSGSLGKIANMVESKSRKPAEFAAGKAKAYGKFGAVSGGKAVGRGFTKLGTKAGFIDPNNPGVVSRSASRVRKGYRSMRAFDKAVDTSLEARKRGREEEIGERAAEIGVSTGMAGKALSSVGGSRYNEIVAAQTEKAFQERVKSIRADLETHLPPSDKYSSRLAAAISSGNREETTALIGYMATAGGAGGRAALEETLSTTAAKSDEMRVAINNSIYRDNYGSLLGSRGSLAKGGLDASGKWQPNLAPVKIEALASQDEGSLQAHFQQIDQKNAQSILDNESLASKISSKKARILFKARARGDALIPDPSDPAKNPPTIRTSSGTEAILRDGNLYDPSTGTEIDESAFF